REPFGFGEDVAGLEAVLPFFAFDVVVVFFAELFVELLPLRLVGVVLGVKLLGGGGERGGVEFFVPFFVFAVLEILVIVVVRPPFIGRVLGIGGEDVEGEAFAVAIGRRAHPE